MNRIIQYVAFCSLFLSGSLSLFFLNYLLGMKWYLFCDFDLNFLND